MRRIPERRKRIRSTRPLSNGLPCRRSNRPAALFLTQQDYTQQGKRSQRAKRHAILALGHIMEVCMTSSQRDFLRQLRRSGKSYGQIAQALNISENTAKSICRREGILAIPESVDHCPRCGKPVSHAAQGSRRRFCSDTCRYAWNFAHRVLSETNAVSKRCDCCGQLFFSYPSSGRKYCSRACYIHDRFGKEARHGSRTV